MTEEHEAYQSYGAGRHRSSSSGSIAAALGDRRLGHGRVVLGSADVHGSGGKITEPAGVIEIEMGDDDVAHVLGGEAERRELRDRRLGDVAARPRDGDELAPE